MRLKYKLYFKDYQVYSLYLNSKSKTTKRARVISFIAFFIALILISSIIGYNLTYLIIFSLSLIAYPFFHKYTLKKQNEKYIKELFQWNFDKENTLVISDDELYTYNEIAESKIYYSSLKNIIEISSHFFLDLKAGSKIIIPKSEIKNTNEVRAKLKEIAQKSNITYSKELNWKW